MSKRTGSPAAAILLIALLAASPATAEVRVTASVDRNPATEGEGFVLSVTVAGAPGGSSIPELPESLTETDFDLYSTGTSRHMSIVNGRSETSISYEYNLIPRHAGTITIPGIPVRVGTERFTTSPIQLEVRKRSRSAPNPRGSATAEGDAEDVLLLSNVDRQNVVEGEEVLLTLQFCWRGQLLDRPEFEPPNTQGFITELLSDDVVGERLVNGVRYTVQEIRYALFPVGHGDKTIGAARIRATVPTRRRRDAFSMFGSWFDGKPRIVESEPIDVHVDPLPPTDDPDFSGAVGRFTLEASLDRTDVTQHDPVTLAITIEGVGNLGSAGDVRAPETSRFRVFDASTDMEPKTIDGHLGGRRRIRRAFVPLEAGSLQVPAVRFTYFDTDARAYRTLAAGPFAIDVTPAEAGTAQPVVVGKDEIRVLKEDIRYIRTSIGTVRATDAPPSPARFAVHLIPALAMAGALVWRRRTDRLSANAALVRARGAAVRARGRMADAAKTGAPDALWGAIGGYVGDRLNTSGRVLTVEDAGRLLRARVADDALIERVVAFGRACDYARFAPGARSESNALAAESAELLRLLEGVDWSSSHEVTA